MASERSTPAESKSPEEIQAEIETTREELGDTVGEIADKADVKKQAKRKVDEAKAKVAAKKERISGKVDDTKAKVAAKKEGSSDKAPAEQAIAAAQENPVAAAAGGALAAGLVIGWFLGRR
jgi:ElaB/YqjD/DUF883 family membrane-anchored ribosome-binding protein